MKPVIFTADVEGHVGADPVFRLIFGVCAGGKRMGIEALMDICDRHGVRGLFFVDIAEAWHYGEERLADVLRYIASRGHDVGVHIHPDHMADPDRLFLAEYSEAEQRDMLTRCTNFYQKVLGTPPRAFRAGKYGADQTTLDILAELGYQADFSEFFGQKWCRLDPPVTGDRTVVLENGLIEVPTTSYRTRFGRLYSRCDKVDESMTFYEYKHLLPILAREESVNVVVLFAHSFSLLKWRSRPDKPKADRRAQRRLTKMFGAIAASSAYAFVSLDDLLRGSYAPQAAFTPDVPTLPLGFSVIAFVPKVMLYLKSKLTLFVRDKVRRRPNRKAAV